VAVGLRKEDVEPFPKFHDHDVGLLVERSVKFTMIGEQPERGVPVKLAFGTWLYAELKAVNNVKTKTQTSFECDAKVLLIAGEMINCDLIKLGVNSIIYYVTQCFIQTPERR
jgi:hypothetical protein